MSLRASIIFCYRTYLVSSGEDSHLRYAARIFTIFRHASCPSSTCDHPVTKITFHVCLHFLGHSSRKSPWGSWSVRNILSRVGPRRVRRRTLWPQLASMLHNLCWLSNLRACATPSADGKDLSLSSYMTDAWSYSICIICRD